MAISKQEWSEKIEHLTGRKPTIEEFKKAKASGVFQDDVQDANAVGDEQPIQQSTPQSFVQQQSVVMPKKQMTGLTKALIGLGVGVVVIAGGGYYAGTQYFSRENSLKRVKDAVSSQNATQLANVIVWRDSNKTISKSELLPFKRMIAESSVKQVNHYISENNLTGYKFENKGRNFLIFPNWKLIATPISYKVTSNYAGLKLKVNDKNIGTSTETYSKSFAHQLPGFYSFSGTGKINDKIQTITDEGYMDAGRNDIRMNVTFKSFTVYSNLTDGDLYSGDTKIGTLKDGQLDVKKFPVAESSKVFVKKEIEGHIIKTKSVSMSSIASGDSLTLNAKGLMTQSDADTLMSSFYDGLQSYASYNKTPNDLDDYLVNGSDNKFWTDMSGAVDANMKSANREASSLDLSDLEIKSVSMIGYNKYRIGYNIKYDFYYPSDDDNDNSGDIIQNIYVTADAVYDKSTNTFKITGPGPDQKVLSDKNNVE